MTIDPMHKCFMRRDATSVEMKEDLRSNCQTEGMPEQQARPEGEDVYSEESDESKDDSTADGEERVTLSKTQPEIEPDLVQHTCICQKENNPASISRHVESDNDGRSCPHEPTLRDPTLWRESQCRIGAAKRWCQ